MSAALAASTAGQPTIDEVNELRHRLVDNGYLTVAVRTNMTRPAEAAWQRAKAFRSARVGALSTGLRTGRGILCIDINCDDPHEAKEVYRRVVGVLGETPLVRSRSNSSRVALVWRALENEIKKIKIKLAEPIDGKLQQIEVLADGQQFVAFGQHDSGVFYDWLASSPLDVLVEDLPAIDMNDLIALQEEFGVVEEPEPAPQIQQKTAISRVPTAALPAASGDNFFRNVNNAALANIIKWGPVLFPGSRLTGQTLRVTSRQLGRKYQEDLSISPMGVQDFGVEETRTAVDLVIEYGGAPDAEAGALWLCQRMGLDPVSLGHRSGMKEDPVEQTRLEKIGTEALKVIRARRDHLITSAASLDLVNAAELADKPIREREWGVLDLIPLWVVTLFSGDGGTGKSLLALQLAISVALGWPWLGRAVKQGRVLYLSAEDDIDEVHRRLFNIAAAEGFDLSRPQDLTIAPLAGLDAILAAENPKTKLLAETRLWHLLVAAVTKLLPVLIILDTSADLFGGDEVKRVHVRQFIGLLKRLAMISGAAVVLLSHPSVAGMQSGSGISGFTAWNNSVRSRLYLTRPKDDDGAPADPDVRVLETMKANYGRTGEQIRLRREEGRFLCDEPQRVNLGGFRSNAAEEVFLALLAKFNAQGRPVSPAPSVTYAPSQFEKEPEAKGIRKAAFARAMGLLLDQGRIEIVSIGRSGKRRQSLQIASDSRKTMRMKNISRLITPGVPRSLADARPTPPDVVSTRGETPPIPPRRWAPPLAAAPTPRKGKVSDAQSLVLSTCFEPTPPRPHSSPTTPQVGPFSFTVLNPVEAYIQNLCNYKEYLMNYEFGTIVRINSGKRTGLVGRVVETAPFERDNDNDVAIETEISTIWERPINLAIDKVQATKVRSLRHRLTLEYYKFSDGSQALTNWDDAVIWFREADSELHEIDPGDDYAWPDMIRSGVWVASKDRLLVRNPDGKVNYPASLVFLEVQVSRLLGQRAL